MNFFIKIYYVIRYIPFYSISNQVESKFIDIDFELLKNRGINYIITDVDQTIVAQSSNEISKEVCDKMEEIKKIFGNSSICFLTNEPSKKRHDILFKQINIETVDTLGIQKPLPLAFNYALRYFKKDISNDEVCFIGDRIWTDIIGANNVNLYTIKVDPYDINSDRFITSILRRVENNSTKLLAYLKLW